MPWVLAKDEATHDRLATVLYNLLEAISGSATLLSAFMPSTMPKALEQIGAKESDITYENAGKFGVLPADVTVNKGEVLFPRIDVEKEIEALNEIINQKYSKHIVTIEEPIEFISYIFFSFIIILLFDLSNLRPFEVSRS